MRRYDDLVEVRRGVIGGATEGPEQFWWRGRVWKVREVLAHWVETGPWWQSTDVRTLVGTDSPAVRAEAPRPRPGADLLAERECWRVEAGRGPGAASGVFELSFSWADGSWQLVGCQD